MTPEARSDAAIRRPVAGESVSDSVPRAGRSLSWLYYVVLPVLFILVWFLLTDVMTVFPGALLPSPVKVANAFGRAIASGELAGNIGASLQRILYADLAALALGVPLGLAMGLYQRIEKLLDGLLSLFRPIPPLAWVPLAILWFGIGTISIVFITFLSAFFAILVSTIAGVRSLDKLHVRAALSLGASRRRLLTHVVLPTTLPSIFTGLRIAIGVSWMSIVGAELIAASSGLGYMINYYQQVLRTDLVIVGMITIGVIGLVMDLSSRWIERRLLPWRQGVRLP
jgi:ABC-type nitrate/sulfonate/bicarbonate transport system permease component